MALKFRGKTQIKDASLSLDKLAHSSQKRLVGNQSDSFGESTTLTNNQARNLMGLGVSDDPTFATLSAATVTSTQSDSASDSLKSTGSLSVTDASGTTTLSGKLDVQGTGNTASDLTVNAGGSFEVDSTGSADFNSDLTVTNSSLTTDTLSVTQSGAGSTTLTGHVDFDSSLTVDGLSTLSGGILVNNSNITHSRDSAGVNVALTSPNVDLNGGNIDGTVIGSSDAAGAEFTSLTTVSSSGDVTVNGNLTVQSGSVLSKLESELEISDPLLLLAKDNSTGDTLDMGIIGKYSTSTGSVSNIVQNGTFDSDISNWSEVSAPDKDFSWQWNQNPPLSVTITYTYSREHSNDFGSGAMKLSAGRYPRGLSNGIFTQTAASQQTISYAFTDQNYSIEAKIYYNSSEVTSDTKYRIVALNESARVSGKDARTESPTSGGTSEWKDLPTSGSTITLTTAGDLYMLDAEMTIGFNLVHTGGVEYNSDQYNRPVTPKTSVAYFDDVKIYDANGNEVTPTVQSGYAGIVRDADGSGNFKLFNSSDSNIPNAQTINFGLSSKSVLDADIEGDIAYDAARNFNLSGDAVSAPQSYYGSGNTVTMTAAIQDGSIQVGNIDFLTDQDDMVYPGLENFGSPTHIPTQQSVKAYVSDTVSKSSYTGLQPKEIRMARSIQGGDISFTSVEKVFFKKTCDPTDQGNDYVTLSKDYQLDFVSKSEVYLNGQKLRYGQNYDCYFSESNKLNLNNDVLYSGDRIELQYFVQSAAIKTNSHVGRTGVSKITTGNDHTLIVNNDGRVFVSGGNTSGQLGLGNTTSLGSDIRLNDYFANNSKTIIDAAGGRGFSLFVDDDGKVYSTGKGGYGQLGLNSTTDYTTPQEITYFSTAGITIVKVFAGEYHSMALDDNDNLYGWGRNDKGQLGLGHFNSPILVPTALDMSNFDGDPKKVNLGGLHSLVITDQDKSYTFGDNSEGQLGIGNTTNQHTPQLVNSNTLTGAAGGKHTLMITKDTTTGGPSDLLGSGSNNCGQLGPPSLLGSPSGSMTGSRNILTSHVLTMRPVPLIGPSRSRLPLAVGAKGNRSAFVLQPDPSDRNWVHTTDVDSNCVVGNCCDISQDPVYKVKEASNKVNEGSSLAINVSTENVLDDTVLYWTIESSQTNSSDFNAVSGNFTVTDGSGSFTVNPTEDNTTEGSETFTVAIRTGGTNGTKVAETGTITIGDVSLTPPTYEASPNFSDENGDYFIYEGYDLKINVSTTNVADDTTLYWVITSNTGDFEVSTGSFTINSGKGSFTVTPTADGVQESGEQFTVAIRTSPNGSNVEETSAITIEDFDIEHKEDKYNPGDGPDSYGDFDSGGDDPDITDGTDSSGDSENDDDDIVIGPFGGPPFRVIKIKGGC